MNDPVAHLVDAATIFVLLLLTLADFSLKWIVAAFLILALVTSLSKTVISILEPLRKALQ